MTKSLHKTNFKINPPGSKQKQVNSALTLSNVLTTRENTLLMMSNAHFEGIVERGKREVYCDKQVEKAVTVLNCMLKGSWGEGRSGVSKRN